MAALGSVLKPKCGERRWLSRSRARRGWRRSRWRWCAAGHPFSGPHVRRQPRPCAMRRAAGRLEMPMRVAPTGGAAPRLGAAKASRGATAGSKPVRRHPSGRHRRPSLAKRRCWRWTREHGAGRSAPEPRSCLRNLRSPTRSTRKQDHHEQSRRHLPDKIFQRNQSPARSLSRCGARGSPDRGTGCSPRVRDMTTPPSRGRYAMARGAAVHADEQLRADATLSGVIPPR